MTPPRSAGAPPSWSVAALVDEPPALVAAFVAHHLDQGAAGVRLFLDRPDPALARLVGGDPRVRLHDCTAPGHWRPHPRRPAGLAFRLRHSVSRAVAEMETDWLLFCDADEFVVDGAALGADLAALGPETEELRLPVRERFFPDAPPGAHVFEGAFRAPMGRPGAVTDLHGPETGAFLYDGLTGHVLGKTLYRRGLSAVPGVHRGAMPDGVPSPPRRARMAGATCLYHFDGLTARNWALKLRGKIVAADPARVRRHKSRLAQIDFAKRHDMDAVIALYDRLVRPPADIVAALEAEGLVDRRSFDPRPALARQMPAADPADLAPARYDAALGARFAAPPARRWLGALRRRIRA